MSEELRRLNRIFPDSKYVKISPFVEGEPENKAPLNRWNSNPLSYIEACNAVEEGFRIGWVVPKGYVVVDIDNEDNPLDQEYVEKIIKKFEVAYSYNYTTRGIHILLKDSSEKIKSNARVKCGINISIDTRANETGYIILPENDSRRAWGEWRDSVEEIPYFLKPLGTYKNASFIGMINGDGRNDALFKWLTCLQTSRKLNEEECEKCIRIINEYLFKEAIPNKELQSTVLREKMKKGRPGFNMKSDNVFNNLADELIGKTDIICYCDNFYTFNGIYYKPITKLELEKIIHTELSVNLSSAQRKEIIEFIKIKTQVPPEEFDKDWYKIACKNGVLNLVTGEVERPTKSDINTIYIPYNYNDDTELYSPLIDQFMKDISDGDVMKMQFLYQVAGYALLKKNAFQKFFIFQGEGGTGKSTFTNILNKLVGSDNCSRVSLDNMDKDYYLASMVSKLLNIDDDVVDGKALENTGRFKSIVSGDQITVRQIYKDVLTFTPYATLVFSCNKLPRIMDKTTGLYRRMILVELNHKVAKPDPFFMNRITDIDMEYFFQKAAQGIMIAIEEGHFRIGESEAELLLKFKRRQSPLNEWLYDCDITAKDLHMHKFMPLYSQFKDWAEENGYNKVISSYSFKEDICALYGMELDMQIIDGKGPFKVFIKRHDYNEDFKPF